MKHIVLLKLKPVASATATSGQDKGTGGGNLQDDGQRSGTDKTVVPSSFRVDHAFYQPLKKSLDLLIDIPGVEGIIFDATFTADRARGYTHCIVVELSSTQSLVTYQAHPLHQQALNEIGKVLDKEAKDPVLAMDIETTNQIRKQWFQDRSRRSFRTPFLVVLGVAIMIGMISSRD